MREAIKAGIATVVGLGLYLQNLAVAAGMGFLFLEWAPLQYELQYEREIAMLGVLVGGLIGYIPVALLRRAYRNGRLPSWL